jgi:biopolymer transport protein ExbD
MRTHRRSKKSHSSSLKHEINVTPFVDVMLVLLIIFMVSAPMMHNNIPVDLPISGGSKEKGSDNPPVFVTIDGAKKLFLNDKEVSQEALLQGLKPLLLNASEPIHLRGDKTLPYDVMVTFMDFLRKNGFSKIALVVRDCS